MAMSLASHTYPQDGSESVCPRPMATTASSKIPQFDRLIRWWKESSPLPWDPVKDKAAVADAVVFLLSCKARRITGQVLTVDGGASIIGGGLLESERPEQSPA